MAPFIDAAERMVTGDGTMRRTQRILTTVLFADIVGSRRRDVRGREPGSRRANRTRLVLLLVAPTRVLHDLIRVPAAAFYGSTYLGSLFRTCWRWQPA